MPEFVGSPLPKWRAIPLDHRLKSLLRPGGGEEKEQKGEEQEGEKVEEEGKRRSKSTILAQELAETWCGGAGGAKGGVVGVVEGGEKQHKHHRLKGLLRPGCGAVGKGGECDEKQHKQQRLKSLLRRGACKGEPGAVLCSEEGRSREVEQR